MVSKASSNVKNAVGEASPQWRKYLKPPLLPSPFGRGAGGEGGVCSVRSMAIP
jgi:hypothetical protein